MSNQVIRPKDRTEWLKYRESGIRGCDNRRAEPMGNALSVMETQERS